MDFKPFFMITSLALLAGGCMSEKNSAVDADHQQPAAKATVPATEGLFQEGLKSANAGDYKTAAAAWEKAAELNDADAQNNLGVLYELGKGVEKDELKAVYWFEKAAKQNHIAAQFKLGTFYYEGRGIRQDYKRAVEWYRKAAEQNNPQAQSAMGYLYSQGHGVEKDLQQAKLWWEKAAAQGDKDAQVNLQKLKKVLR